MTQTAFDGKAPDLGAMEYIFIGIIVKSTLILWVKLICLKIVKS